MRSELMVNLILFSQFAEGEDVVTVNPSVSQ